MPKDVRLYMTFPNDFWMHPKIHPLSDAAFRVFVEINGYSRMQDLDGRVPVANAKKLWRAKPIGELLANHPERPSLSLDGDSYVIWNYDEHQQTTIARAKAAEISRANGSLGGRPKGNPDITQQVSKKEPRNNPAETIVRVQSQSSETDLPRLSQSSPANLSTGVDMTKIIAAVQKHCGRDCTQMDAYRIVGTVMERSKQTPRNPTAYIIAAIREEPFVFQKLLDESSAA